MKFKVGDRVKVKESFISKIQTPSLIKLLKRGGKIIGRWQNCNNYVYIKFTNGSCYYLYAADLELVKNQQLLFDFMG